MKRLLPFMAFAALVLVETALFGVGWKSVVFPIVTGGVSRLASGLNQPWRP